MAKKGEKDLEQRASELDALQKKLEEVSAGLVKQQEAVDAEKETVKKRKTALAKEQERLIGLEKELDKREAALAGVQLPAVEETEKPELGKDDIDLIEEAMNAYCIAPEHVLNANIDRRTGKAVILTEGGAKVRYAYGDEKAEDFKPLPPERVDGVSRKKPKAVVGKKK